MKVGSITIPDVLYDEQGNPVRSADVVSAVRTEFRELESVLGFHHMLNWWASRKVMWIVRRKHYYRYLGRRQFAAISLVYFNYTMTGDTMFNVNEVFGVQSAYISKQTLRKYLTFCIRPGFVDRITWTKFVLTEDGINLGRLISHEYANIITKNKEILWKSQLAQL